jgi:hypothetical protein
MMITDTPDECKAKKELLQRRKQLLLSPPQFGGFADFGVTPTSEYLMEAWHKYCAEEQVLPGISIGRNAGKKF